MSISPISSSTSRAQEIAQMAQRLFKSSDTNGDKAIDADELKTAVTAASKGSKSSQAPTADQMMKELDTDGDSKITEEEFTSGLQNKEASGSSQAGAPAGGPPPGGGGGKAKSTEEANTDDTKVYDKMDTDKDGTVSYEEEQAYYQKHPEAEKKKAVEEKLTSISPWERTGETINTKA